VSLLERPWGKHKRLYYVFHMRKEKGKKFPRELYLGPKDNPNPERVREALKYVEELKGEYDRRYDELRDKLLKLLPQDERGV